MGWLFFSDRSDYFIYYFKMNDHDFKTIYAMKQYGGGFVHKLAELFELGDLKNQNKLKVAFSGYFKDYEERAKALWPEQK